MKIRPEILLGRTAAACALAVTLGTAASGAILFEDDFSHGLAAWTGRNGQPHHGQIMADPLKPGNFVLSFTGLSYSGDILMAHPVSVVGFSKIILSFDYLGLAQAGSNPGNLGGFVGLYTSSDGLTPDNRGAWLAGTDQSAANGLGFEGIEISDDGTWHHYEINLTPLLTANNIAAFLIMAEDWADAGGVAGDAYFDNFQIVGETDASPNANPPFSDLSFLTNGLVAYFPFNGNARDESGNGNDAQVHGAVLTKDRFGDANGAYSFNGSSQYISAVTSSSVREKTLSAWVLLSNLQQKAGGLVGLRMADASGVDPGRYFDTIVYNETGSSWGFGSDGFSRTDWSNFQEPGLQWVHLVATYSDHKYVLYRDGQPILASSAYGLFSFDKPEIVIGLRHDIAPDQFLAAQIDDVRIYTRSLSSTEVKALFDYESFPRNCALVQNGLVAWWKAEGNANDFTGKHNGTLQNGQKFTTGKVGQGFDFNGKPGSYIEMPDAPDLNLTQAITLEAWIKANNWDGTPRIIQKASDNIAYLFFIQGGIQNPELRLFLWGVNVENSSESGLIRASAPSLGEWHHVAGTYDGSKITLFIDGKIVAQASASGSISVTSDVLNIGNKPHSNDPRPFFDGVIDEVAIYNRALSPSEIQQNVDAGSPGKCDLTDLPVIVSQPQDQELTIGSTAKFSVAAIGKGVLSYQWRFEGARIIGGTNTELVLPKITQADVGSYTVEVSDSTNSIQSKPAMLSLFVDSDGDGLSDDYEKGITRYKLIEGDFNWFEAKTDAETRGGHLATITSQAEWDAILKIIPEEILSTKTIWIGGTDARSEGTWEWITGEPWNFTRWRGGEPNSTSGGGDSDYIELNKLPDSSWNDAFGTDRRQYYLFEIGYYSDWQNPDTDGDGLTDGEEVLKYHTFPNFADSNQNGISDKDELTPRFQLIKFSKVSRSRVVLSGLLGTKYSIEISSDLANWTTWTNFTTTNVTTILDDYSATNQIQRFYRAKQQP